MHRNRGAWLRACLGFGIFAVLAQYPFVSVAALHAPGAASPVAAGLAHAEDIVKNIHRVFPAVLLPLSPGAEKLSDLQLGYGLELCLVAAVAALAGRPSWLAGSLAASAAVLLLLLAPVPPVDTFWRHLPGSIKSITFYWPMQRFYLIVAALIAASFQAAVAGCYRLRWLLLPACLWSVAESRQFMTAAESRRGAEDYSALVQRSENLLLMNHSYGLFAALPPYFSNGVMSPQAEVRLWLGDRVAAPTSRRIRSGDLVGHLDSNPGIVDLTPSLRLEPGQSYELTLSFRHPERAGVLQLTGRNFFRQYTLPESGETKAFGAKPQNAHSLRLWTTDLGGTEVALRFIPGAGAAADLADFAGYDLRAIDPSSEPARIESLAPLRIHLSAVSPGTLETFRMYMPGYRAELDGQSIPVTSSPAGLAAMPVPEGIHELGLRFVGPLRLRLSYGFNAVAWTVVALVAALGRRRQTLS